jgi:D-glycero-alpha-D-manno-heptose-7-phosphate kinase
MQIEDVTQSDKVDLSGIPSNYYLIGLLSAFENRFQAVADNIMQEISWKQFFAVICINMCKEPPTLKELSDILGSSHQNVKQILLKLEKKGFVTTMPDEHDKRKQLMEMLSLVNDAQSILEDSHADINDFGRLLDYSWKLKRGTGSKISNNTIDELYERGIKAGALGGKLLGAGGGGFLLFYVEKEKQEHVINALHELMHVPFELENEGSTVIHYNPIVYIPRKEIKI